LLFSNPFFYSYKIFSQNSCISIIGFQLTQA